MVIAGHEHFYERLKPQKGIHYFTAGGSAKLRAGDIVVGAMTAKGFDTDQSFMLIEIDGDYAALPDDLASRPAGGLRDDHASNHRRNNRRHFLIQWRHPFRVAAGILLAATVAAVLTASQPANPKARKATLSELWRDPGNIAAKDLRWGRGGQSLAPSADG